MVEQMRTVTLKCPSCGASLSISNDMNQFACGYCGTQQIVERKGGTIALKMISDAISRVQIGTDKTAAELALKRLRGELDDLLNRRRGIETIAETQKNKQNQTVYLLYIAIGVVSTIVGVATISWLGLVLFIIAIAVVSVRHYDTTERMKRTLDRDLKSIDLSIEVLKEKVGKNKAVVDS